VGIFFYICRFVGCMVDVMRFSLRLLSIFLVVMCVFQIPFSVFAMEDQTIQDSSSIEPSLSSIIPPDVIHILVLVLSLFYYYLFCNPEAPVPTPELIPVPTPELIPVPTPELIPVPTPELIPVPTPEPTLIGLVAV